MIRPLVYQASRIIRQRPIGCARHRMLEEMTKLDLNYNITRLRSEATTKLAHADLLQAWGAKHFRAHGSA